MQGVWVLTERYEPSNTPRLFFISLLAALLCAPIVYVLARPDHAQAFTRDLVICADERGIRDVEWEIMHGFDAFNIGREFYADSPVEKEALACALQNSAAKVETRSGDMGDQHPVVRIWYAESLFGQDQIIYYTPSS